MGKEIYIGVVFLYIIGSSVILDALDRAIGYECRGSSERSKTIHRVAGIIHGGIFGVIALWAMGFVP